MQERFGALYAGFQLETFVSTYFHVLLLGRQLIAGLILGVQQGTVSVFRDF